MKSIRKEAHEWKISTRHAVTSKALTLRVTACGRKVMMSILGLVWQESMFAVAVLSRKTTEKSDFTTCTSLSFVLPPHNLIFVTNRQVILLNKI